MPQVAVLVAAYNAAATLPQCLDTLCAQTLADIQILCVDDCSTDTTFHLLRQRAANDPRIEIFQTPVNSGQAVARNLALAHATAPFVCMVDADDWLSPDALEQAVAIFTQHPSTDCVLFSLVLHEDSSHSERTFPLPATLLHGQAISGHDAFQMSICGWQLHGLYLTRTALHRQYPFDTTTRLYSDDNTTHLHYLHSREVRSCPGAYFYRKYPESLTTSFNLHRFDIMEANLSLLLTLKKEHIQPKLLRHFEGRRWLTFISTYRLYLLHLSHLPPTFSVALKQRFRTILHTFRPSRLPLRSRWKPGYWLTVSLPAFDAQQRLYLFLHKFYSK